MIIPTDDDLNKMHPEIRKFWQSKGIQFVKSKWNDYGDFQIHLCYSPNLIGLAIFRYADNNKSYWFEKASKAYFEKEFVQLIRLKAFL
jgi:hypothetical protein